MYGYYIKFNLNELYSFVLTCFRFFSVLCPQIAQAKQPVSYVITQLHIFTSCTTYFTMKSSNRTIFIKSSGHAIVPLSSLLVTMTNSVVSWFKANDNSSNVSVSQSCVWDFSYTYELYICINRVCTCIMSVAKFL